MSQDILVRLTQASLEDKCNALVDCESLVKQDISRFAVQVLPTVLSLANSTHLQLRLALLRMIDSLISELRTEQSAEIQYAVTAACIETVGVLFADETVRLRKRVIETVTKLQTIAFTTFAATPGDAKYWSILAIMKTHIDSWFVHPNDGVRANAAKYLAQVVIIQLPRDELDDPDLPSLDLVPPDHPYMNKQQLMTEAVTLLNKFTTFLSSSSQILTSATFLSCVFNCMHDIIASRSQYAGLCLSELIEFQLQPPSYLSALQLRNVERALKVIFVSTYTLPALSQLEEDVTEALVSMGVKSQELEWKKSKSAKKRSAELAERREKRQRLEKHQRFNYHEPIEQMSHKVMLLGVESIPLPLVVDSILHSLSSQTQEQWEAHLAAYLQTILQRTSQAIHDPRRQNAAEPTASNPFQQAPELQSLANEYTANILSVMASAPVQQNQAAKPLKFFQEQDHQLDEAEAQYDQMDQEEPIKDETQDEIDYPQAPTVAIDIDAILNKPVELSDDQKGQLLSQTFQRILSMESYFAIVTAPGSKQLSLIPSNQTGVLSARLGWMLLVIRVVTRSSLDPEFLRSHMLEFITKDFRKRVDLAVMWLHEEYFRDTQIQQKSYQNWFHKLFDNLAQSKLNPEDDQEDEIINDVDNSTTLARDWAFTKLLIEAPVITDHALQKVVEFCQYPVTLQLGISVLRDLVLYRPSVRAQCIKTLLEYCVSPEKAIRAPAIIAIKRFYPEHEKLAPELEAYSIECIQKLEKAVVDDLISTAQSSHVENVGTSPKRRRMSQSQDIQHHKSANADKTGVWTENDVIRHLDLYFSFCSRKHDLIDSVFQLYTRLSAPVRRIVKHNIVGLLRLMSSAPTKLLSLIETFPDGAEDLALQVIEILQLTDHAQAAIQKTIASFEARDLDVRFLAIIMPYLDKERIFATLPKLIDSLDETEEQQKIVRGLFVRLTDQKAGDEVNEGSSEPREGPKKASLTPAELMIRLHQLEDTVAVPKINEALSICFGLRSLFKQEVLAVVLQQLLEAVELPSMYVDTVLKCLELYKGLVSFVNSILIRLLNKKIWNVPHLWAGVTRCCILGFPNTLPVLLALPKPQVVDMLKNTRELQQLLGPYLEQLPMHQRARRDLLMLSNILRETLER